MRKIYCECGKYCGEIRDATLMKGLKFCCTKCEVMQKESVFENESQKDGGQYDFASQLHKFSNGFKRRN